MREVAYPHPGEILAEEFLEPMHISPDRLAQEIGVPPQSIDAILSGKIAVTADTGLRLSRFFGLSEGFWIGLQADYDRETAKDALAEILAAIRPWPANKVGDPA